MQRLPELSSAEDEYGTEAERKDGAEPRGTWQILARCALREISPAVAAMKLLLASGGPVALEATIAALARLSTGDGAQPLDQVLRLLREHGARCAPIAARAARPRAPASPDEAIASCRRFFDWSAAQCEEASVALYSLGDPALLDRATGEVVSVLGAWGVLGRGRSALEIGCGIGRLEVALAGRLAEIHGLDISPRMIAGARRRAGGLSNVFFAESSGRDLGIFGPNRFDLVLAVDSFPYLHAAGGGLIAAHFREIARVLRPGGDLVIFNFSSRDDLEADRSEVSALGRAFGFELCADGVSPFTLWDGVGFHLHREGDADSETRPTLRPGEE
jgi:SAM-dependent methyltransferase